MANPLEASLRLRDEFTKVLTKIDNQLQKTTSTMENFKQKMSAQSKVFSTIASSAQSAMTKLNSAFQKGFSAVQNMVQSSVQRIVTLMGNFGNRIKSSFNLNPLISKVSDTFSKITSTIRSKVSDIGNSLKDVGSRIAKTLKLDKVFSGITKGLDTLKSKVSTTASAIASSFSNIFKSKRVKALDDVNAQLDKLSNKKAHIEVNVANADRAQKRLVDVDSAISKLNSKKARVEAQVAGADKSSQKLEDISTKLNRLNSTRATLQVEANKVEGARKKLAEVQQDIHRLNREKASLQLNINPFTRALSSARSAFDSFKNTVSNGIRSMGTAFKNFGDNMRNSFSHMSSTAGKVQSVFGGIMTALGVTAALGAIKNGIVGISEELNTNSKAWQVFQDNMSMLGKGQGEIDTVKKSLQEFATQTIYNASDMASTYSQMAAIGVKDTENLVKGMAGLASSAEAPGQAMKTLSQQMTQAMAKPELQWMDFKLMMEQAPAGMAQVAKEMGYSLDDFIIAIQDSEIASEDFAAAVAKVGTNENFSKMATEFKTIGQAMDGMRESLANKLEPAFSVFNETGIRAVEAFTGALDRINFDGLADKLKAFADTLDFDAMVDNIASFASKAKEKITDFMDGFKSTGAMDSFVEALESVWGALKHVAENIDYKAIGKIAGEVVDTFSKITKAVGDFVSEIDPNAIGKISTAIAGLAAAFVAFKAVKGVFDIGKGLFNVGGAVTQLFGDLFGGKKGIKTPKGNPLEEAMPKGMSGSGGLGFLDNLGKTANQFAKGAKNIALIYGVIKLIEELAEAMKQVNDKVPADLSSLGPKLGNMAIALTGMGTFVAVAGRIARNNFGNAVKGLAVIAGISGNIMLAAEAMKQIESKVPESMASFAPKLANMAIAISGMGVLVAVAGQLATMNPIGAIAGLATVALISGELMLAAEAMQQVNDKVTDNIGSFASKVANIAIGVGGMFGLVQVVGTLSALNPIGTIAGLATVALIAGELILVAEAMQQVNDKVPDDMSGITTKIDGIKDVIAKLADTSFSEVLGSIGGAINMSAAISALNSLVDMIAPLEALANATVPVEAVKTKISNIKDAIAELSIDSFGEWLSNLVGYENFSGAVSAVSALKNVANNLKGLSEIELDHASARAMVNQLKLTLQSLTVDSLGEAIDNLLGYDSFSTAVESVNALKQVATKLAELATVEIDHAASRAMVNQLKLTLRSLSREGFGEFISDLLGYDDFSSAVDSVNALKQVATKLAELSAVEIDHASARAMVNQLKLTLRSLSREGFGEFIADLLGYDDFSGAVDSVNALIKIANQFVTLSAVEIDLSAVRTRISEIKSTISSLNSFPAVSDNSESYSMASTAITKLTEIRNHLTTLGAVALDVGAVTNTINSIKTAIAQLNSLPTVAVANFGSINALITSVINLATQINRLSTSTQASANGVVTAFSRIGQSANTMRNQTTTALNGMVSAITGSMARARSSAVSGMAGFTSAISSGMARSASIARSGSAQIASAFSGLRGQLYSAGLFAMSGLSSGISAGAGGALSAARRVANSVSSTIRSALKIHSPSRVMIAIGEFVSEGLAKGITSAGKLVDKASSKLAELATPQLDEITGPKVRMGEVLTSGLNAFTTPQMELAGVTRNVTDVYAGQGDYDWDDAQRVSIDSSEIDAMDTSLSRPVIIKNKQIMPEINLTIEGKDAEDIDTDEIIRRIEEIIIDANNDDLG